MSEPDPDHIRHLLQSIKTIASIGLSANPERESFQIDQYLVEQGYRVIPVNPMASEVFGEKAYPDLASVPEMPDVAQVFRKPEDAGPVVDQVIAKGVKLLWFQEGTSDPVEAQRAREAGIEVIENLCMRAAHRFLINNQR